MNAPRLAAVLAVALVMAWLPAAATAAAAAAQHLPLKQAGADDDAMLYRTLAAFVLAAGCAVGIAYAIKRFSGRFGSIGAARHAGARLERIDLLRLSQKSTLFVVRHAGQEWLLAEHEQGITVLSQPPAGAAARQGDDHG